MHVPLSSGYWKMYSIVIQLGAILTLPVYFRQHIAKLVSTFPEGEKRDCNYLTHPLSLVMIAFVVTAIPAFLLTKVIGKNLESLYVMGAALLVGGVVMWVIDAMFGERVRTLSAAETTMGQAAVHARVLEYETPPIPAKTARVEDMTLMQAIWIGAVQIMSAVFPGTSRSMSTIAAGQVAGMTRASALEFSFFLSLPTMVVATCYDLLKSLRHGAANPIGTSSIDTHGWTLLAIGFVVSFIVAYASVAWFMAWVRRRGFAPFAVYRIILGIAVLMWISRTG